jgi:hypothetical protein
MTENRIFWYVDDNNHEIGKASHDSSIIASLPRAGDHIIDKVKLDFQENENTIEAIVNYVEFRYDLNSIVIYARVIRSA